MVFGGRTSGHFLMNICSFARIHLFATRNKTQLHAPRQTWTNSRYHTYSISFRTEPDNRHAMKAVLVIHHVAGCTWQIQQRGNYGLEQLSRKEPSEFRTKIHLNLSSASQKCPVLEMLWLRLPRHCSATKVKLVVQNGCIQWRSYDELT